MDTFLFSILSYLMGSFPTGLVIGKIFYKKDIREYGSKNIGGTNATRVLGTIPGLIVEAVDVLKVFIPTFIATHYIGINMGAIVGFAGTLGHCYSIFLKLKGGKGVACFFGTITALNPLIGIGMIVIWKILKHTLNYVSLASIISCFMSSFVFLIYYGFDLYFVMLLLGAAVITYKHRLNISRLFKGTENKVNPNR